MMVADGRRKVLHTCWIHRSWFSKISSERSGEKYLFTKEFVHSHIFAIDLKLVEDSQVCHSVGFEGGGCVQFVLV